MWIFSLLYFFLAFLSHANSLEPAEFVDADLTKLKSQTAGTDASVVVLLSWSPHMILSQKAVDEALAQAKVQKFTLEVVLDPNSNWPLAQKIAKAHQWPESFLRQMYSAELIRKGFRTHYPSYIFIAKGNLVSPLIPGLKSAPELATLLSRYAK